MQAKHVDASKSSAQRRRHISKAHHERCPRAAAPRGSNLKSLSSKQCQAQARAR